MKSFYGISLRHVVAVAAQLLLGATVFAASAYVEQTQTTSAIGDHAGSTSHQKMWLTDSMVCIQDEEKGVVFVLRDDEVYIVKVAERVYAEMTLQQFTATFDATSAMASETADGKPVEAEVIKTKQKADVGEWKAYQVTVDWPGPQPVAVELWYSKNVGASLGDWPNLIELLHGQIALDDAIDKLAKFKGYPVKYQSTVTVGDTTATQLTEVTRFDVGSVDAPDLCGPPDDFARAE